MRPGWPTRRPPARQSALVVRPSRGSPTNSPRKGRCPRSRSCSAPRPLSGRGPARGRCFPSTPSRAENSKCAAGRLITAKQILDQRLRPFAGLPVLFAAQIQDLPRAGPETTLNFQWSRSPSSSRIWARLAPWRAATSPPNKLLLPAPRLRRAIERFPHHVRRHLVYLVTHSAVAASALSPSAQACFDLPVSGRHDHLVEFARPAFRKFPSPLVLLRRQYPAAMDHRHCRPADRPFLCGDLRDAGLARAPCRSEEHTSELQSPCNLVCRLLLEKNNSSVQLQ